MISRRDTAHREIPDSAELTHLNGAVKRYDWSLRYQTWSYDGVFSDYGMEVEIDDAGGGKDTVTVLFEDSDFEIVSQNIAKHLEEDSEKKQEQREEMNKVPSFYSAHYSTL